MMLLRYWMVERVVRRIRIKDKSGENRPHEARSCTASRNAIFSWGNLKCYEWGFRPTCQCPLAHKSLPESRSLGKLEESNRHFMGQRSTKEVERTHLQGCSTTSFLYRVETRMPTKLKLIVCITEGMESLSLSMKMTKDRHDRKGRAIGAATRSHTEETLRWWTHLLARSIFFLHHSSAVFTEVK